MIRSGSGFEAEQDARDYARFMSRRLSSSQQPLDDSFNATQPITRRDLEYDYDRSASGSTAAQISARHSTPLSTSSAPQFAADSSKSSIDQYLLASSLSSPGNNARAPVASSGHCFQVVARLRPTGNSMYLEQSGTKITDVREDMKTLVLGKDMMNSNKHAVYRFLYDRVFTESDSYARFYTKCVAPMLSSFYSGINCTIYTYGYTRAGKSYTIEGGIELDKRGVLPRVVYDVFRSCHQQAAADAFGSSYTIKVSYVQVYNEVITDLLAQNSHNLRVVDSDDGRAGVVADLTWKVLRDPSDIFDILRKGRTNRVTPPGHSKPPDLFIRSHTVLTIMLEQTKAVGPKRSYAAGESPGILRSSLSSSLLSEAETVTIRSKFSFVEFAGSEKSKEIGPKAGTTTTPTGEVKLSDDGSKIALSFHALMSVVSFLSRKGAHHVPYRDCKMTFLLKDALNDESLNLFVACLYPLPENFAECLSTAKYASRLRQNASLISSTVYPVEDLTASRFTLSGLDYKLSSTGDSKKVQFSTMDYFDHYLVDTRRQLRRAQEDIARLTSEKRELEDHCRTIKAGFTGTSLEQEFTYEQLARYKEETERLTVELERAHSELEELRAMSSYNAPSSISFDGESLMEYLQSQRQEMYKLVARLEEEQQARQAAEQIAKQLQYSRSGVDFSNNTSSINKIKEYSETISDLRYQLARMRQDLAASKRQQVVNQSQDSSFYAADTSSLNTKLYLLGQEVQSLRLQLKEALELGQAIGAERDALQRDLLVRHAPPDLFYRVQQVFTDKLKYGKEVDAKEKQLQACLGEIHGLRLELAELRSTYQRAARLRQQLEEVRFVAKYYEYDLEEMYEIQSSRNELKERVRQLEKELAESKYASSNLDQQRSMLQQNLDTTQTALSNAKREMLVIEKERDALRSRCSMGEKERQILDQELGKLRYRQQALLLDKDRLNTEIFEKTKEILEMQAAVLRLRSVVERSVADSPAKTPERKQLHLSPPSPSKIDLSTDIDGIVANVKLISSNTKSVCAELEQLEDQLERSNRTISDQKEYISRLYEEMRELNHNLALQRQDSEVERDEKERIRRLLADKESELRTARHALDTTLIEVKQTQTSADSYLAKFEQTRAELLEATSQLRKAYDRVKILELDLQYEERATELAYKERDLAQDEARKARDEVTDALNRQHKLKELLQYAENRMQEAEEAAAEAQQQAETVLYSNRALEAKLREQDGELQTIHSENMRLYRDLEHSNTKAKDEARKAQQLEESNKSLLMQNANLKLEAHRAKEEVETSYEHLELTKKEMEIINQIGSKEKTSLQQELDGYKYELAEVHRELGVYQERIKYLTAQLENKDRDNQDLRYQLEASIRDIRERNEEREVLVKQLRTKESELLDQQSNIRGLYGYLGQLESTGDKDKQIIEKMRYYIEDSNTALKELSNLARQREQDLTVTRADRDEAYSESRARKQEIDKLKDVIENLQKRIAICYQDIFLLKAEKDDLSDVMEATMGQQQSLARQRDDLQIKLARAESIIQQKDDERCQLERELLKLSSEMSHKQSSQSMTEASLRQLQRELTEALKEKKRAKDELALKTTEVYMLTDEKRRLVSRIEEYATSKKATRVHGLGLN